MKTELSFKIKPQISATKILLDAATQPNDSLNPGRPGFPQFTFQSLFNETKPTSHDRSEEIYEERRKELRRRETERSAKRTTLEHDPYSMAASQVTKPRDIHVDRSARDPHRDGQTVTIAHEAQLARQTSRQSESNSQRPERTSDPVESHKKSQSTENSRVHASTHKASVHHKDSGSHDPVSENAEHKGIPGSASATAQKNDNKIKLDIKTDAGKYGKNESDSLQTTLPDSLNLHSAAHGNSVVRPHATDQAASRTAAKPAPAPLKNAQNVNDKDIEQLAQQILETDPAIEQETGNIPSKSRDRSVVSTPGKNTDDQFLSAALAQNEHLHGEHDIRTNPHGSHLSHSLLRQQLPMDSASKPDGKAPEAVIDSPGGGSARFSRVSNEKIPTGLGAVIDEGSPLVSHLMGAETESSMESAPSSTGLTFAAVAATRTASRMDGSPLLASRIDTPLTNPEFREQFARQVASVVVQGQDRAEIRLTPAELGPIRIRVSLNAEDATLDISAAHAATRSAIESSMSTLKQMLADHGLRLADCRMEQNNNPSFLSQHRQPHHDSAFSAQQSGPGFGQSGNSSQGEPPTTPGSRRNQGTETSHTGQMAGIQGTGGRERVSVRTTNGRVDLFA
ncbi:MAG: flagellar hook-length control protein FliK [Lautropia sp.]|nr:flagellar hook-length control protein FliK [Lautropia sp.]